jgi:hypothetical protein
MMVGWTTQQIWEFLELSVYFKKCGRHGDWITKAVYHKTWKIEA